MKKFTDYKEVWIFCVILLVALVSNILLNRLGDPWSWSDWASNLIFAFAITLTTLLLGRRQSRLQESLAALALSEKIAVISGSTDVIEEYLHVGNVNQLFNDIRAGLYLYSFGDQKTCNEYLQMVCIAVKRIEKSTVDDSLAYINWTADQWRSVSDTVSLLIKALEEKITSSIDHRNKHLIEAFAGLEKLRTSKGIDGEIPFYVFERKFRQGDAGNIIRVMINWDFLKKQFEESKAVIKIIRNDSNLFLQDRTVYSPWYTNENDQFVDYNFPNSNPLAYNQPQNYLNVLPKEHLIRIHELQKFLRMHPNGKIPTIQIITLRLANDKVLVLDGNHRIAAVFVEQSEWENPISAHFVEYQVCTESIEKLLPDFNLHYLDSPYRKDRL